MVVAYDNEQRLVLGDVEREDGRASVGLHVAQVVTPVLEEQGCALVRVRVQGQGRSGVLQMLIERKDGAPTGIDDCIRVTRSLKTLLLVEQVLDDLDLEISSPGIARPLTRRGDFKRFCGSRIRLEIYRSEAKEQQRTFCGTLLDFVEDCVCLETPEGVARIPFGSIQKARVLTDSMQLPRAAS